MTGTEVSDGQAGAAKLATGPAAAPDNGARPAARTSTQRKSLGTRAAANRALRLTSAQGRQEAVRRVAGRVQAMLENATARAMKEGELTVEGDVRVLVAKTIPEYYTMFMDAVRYLDGYTGGDPFGLRDGETR